MLSIQKRNVVAGTCLRFRGLLLFGGRIERISRACRPGAELFQEAIPACQVDERSFLDGGGGDTVASNGTPECNVRRGERVSDDERSEKQVSIEALKVRVNGAKVRRGK